MVPKRNEILFPLPKLCC